jgi:hypothetical protein
MPREAPIRIAIDSGAHSISSQMGKKDEDEPTRRRQKASGQFRRMLIDMQIAHRQKQKNFHKKPEFKLYLKKYIEYLHQFKEYFEFYVTLDIIFQAEASWEIYKEMRANDLDPLPVYHYSEDIKWFAKYCEETDYVGIGGLGQLITKPLFFQYADPVFNLICSGNYRRHAPDIRVHGFALGNYDVMSRYPFHSVDASSPFYTSSMGCITMPIWTNGEPNYCAVPKKITVTSRNKSSNAQRTHFRSMPDVSHRFKAVEEYLDQLGTNLEETSDDYGARNLVNLYFASKMARAISALHSERYGKKFKTINYASGPPSGGSLEGLDQTLDRLKFLKAVGHLAHLGSYYHKRTTDFFLKNWYGENA